MDEQKIIKWDFQEEHISKLEKIIFIGIIGKYFWKNKEKNIALNFMEKYKKPKKYKNKT